MNINWKRFAWMLVGSAVLGIVLAALSASAFVGMVAIAVYSGVGCVWVFSD